MRAFCQDADFSHKNLCICRIRVPGKPTERSFPLHSRLRMPHAGKDDQFSICQLYLRSTSVLRFSGTVLNEVFEKTVVECSLQLQIAVFQQALARDVVRTDATSVTDLRQRIRPDSPLHLKSAVGLEVNGQVLAAEGHFTGHLHLLPFSGQIGCGRQWSIFFTLKKQSREEQNG